MSINPEKTFERAMLQVNGMNKYVFNAKNAPIPTSIIKGEAESILATRTLQQSLKAQLHETTQLLYGQTKQLEENIVRNVHYFMGIWGKSDKRLEKIGGKARSKTRRRSLKTKIQEAALPPQPIEIKTQEEYPVNQTD